MSRLRIAQSGNCYLATLMPSRSLHSGVPLPLTSISRFRFSYLTGRLDFAVFVERELAAWRAAALVTEAALYCVCVPADLLYLVCNCNVMAKNIETV
jgi:hypothetical protein